MAVKLPSNKESIFQSRLARRIFLNFIACALIPLTATTVIVFYQVTHEMELQTRSVLDREIKSIVLGLIERLNLHQIQMEMLAASIHKTSDGEFETLADVPLDKFRRWFKGAGVANSSGRAIKLFGQLDALPDLSAVQRSHIRAGGVVVTVAPNPSSDGRIYIAGPAPFEPDNKNYLWIEANTDHLWEEGITKHLPYGAQACIFDSRGVTVHSSFQFPAAFKQRVIRDRRSRDRGHFDLTIADEAYAATFRSLPLKMQFRTQDWSVVLVQQKNELTRAIEKFKRIFPLVMLITIGIVALLSINMIRNSLGPLKCLIRGTGRIAHKDFSRRIEVASKDEFNDLARAFNDMSAQLDQQFRTMAARSEVDRAILSFLDKERIVAAIIGGIEKILDCDYIGIGILDRDDLKPLQCFHHIPGSTEIAEIEPQLVVLKPDDLDSLPSPLETVIIFDNENRPDFFSTFAPPDISYQAVFPVVVKQKLSAFILLGYRSYTSECHDHFEQARKMADHMAVAMANAMLVNDLNQSHWSSLHALARAVDAKSPWTAGHSERVTETALKIGRALGLSDAEMNRLHRGALLHDLGKIGVPANILDKKGKLTTEEFSKIKSHPAIGIRILEPIDAFREVIPIVKQHHERYDGKGYPHGLAGEAIDWGARILAVADVYDALRSDRPYREGWPDKKVLNIIEQGAGTLFDPNVVTVFLSEMKQADDRKFPKPHCESADREMFGGAGALVRQKATREANA